MLTFEEFKKCELIVATIKDVQDHPDADRLYVVKVDTGKEEKQLVAGIKKCYAKEDLVGRQVVVINNMAPAVIRGVESQGMLLAASDVSGMTIIRPDRDVELGSTVK